MRQSGSLFLSTPLKGSAQPSGLRASLMQSEIKPYQWIPVYYYYYYYYYYYNPESSQEALMTQWKFGFIDSFKGFTDAVRDTSFSCCIFFSVKFLIHYYYLKFKCVLNDALNTFVQWHWTHFLYSWDRSEDCQHIHWTEKASFS